MLRHAKAVDDGRGLGRRVHLRRSDEVVHVDAADLRHALGRVLGDEVGELCITLRARGDERPVDQRLVDDDMGHAVGKGHVRAGLELEVDVRLRGQPDVARIDDDELRAGLHRLANLHAEDRMCFLGVGPHQQDDIAFGRDVGDRVRHCARTKCCCQTGNRGSVSNTGTVIDIVSAEGRARHLLEEVDILVCRT